MTAMTYVIVGACVLLAVAGLLWYVLLTRKDTGEEQDETPENTVKEE